VAPLGLLLATLAVAGDHIVLDSIAQFTHGVEPSNMHQIVIKPKAVGQIQDVRAWLVGVYIALYIEFVFHGIAPVGGRNPGGFLGFQLKNAANNVFIHANCCLLVCISNAELAQIHRQKQGAVVISQWTVLGHTQKNVVDRALSGGKCHFVSFGLSA
jgi:hypothetical protein